MTRAGAPATAAMVSRAGAWWAVLGAIIAALLAPLLITDVPPILDYPNHLARLVLLAAGPDDPVLGRIFVPAWSILPNLAVDLIGPPLLRVLDVHTAGRILLGATILLNLAGVITLHRAYFGRRSFWPLAAGLVACNYTFLFGFLNWQIGSGLAMLSAAAWLRWRETRPIATVLGGALAAIVLFFCHLLGVAFFLLLIGSAELRAMRSARAAWVRIAGLAAVAAGPVVLATRTPLRDAPAGLHWLSPALKLEQAAAPFMNYLWPLDMGTAALVYGGVALGIAFGRLSLAPQASVAMAVLLLAYVVLPFDLMSTAFLDTRVAVMAGYLLFAAVDPVRMSRWLGPGVAVTLTVLFIARMGVLADAWGEHRSDVAALRAAIGPVPSGAAVYLTTVPRAEAPSYWDAGPRSRELSNGLRADFHLPALLLIERGAFWPVLFANPAQQPIRLRPPYARLARIAATLPSHAELSAEPGRAWPALLEFDFVLLLEAGAQAEPAGFLPGCLTPLVRTGFAALFRVRRDATGCADPAPAVTPAAP